MCAVYRDVVQAVLTIMGYHGVGYYILYYCVCVCFFSFKICSGAVHGSQERHRDCNTRWSLLSRPSLFKTSEQFVCGVRVSHLRSL